MKALNSWANEIEKLGSLIKVMHWPTSQTVASPSGSKPLMDEPTTAQQAVQTIKPPIARDGVRLSQATHQATRQAIRQGSD